MTTQNERTDHNAEAEWGASEELRAEFLNDYTIYCAFRNAEARGAFKVMGRGKAGAINQQPQAAQVVRPSTGRVRRVLDQATGQWTTIPA